MGTTTSSRFPASDRRHKSVGQEELQDARSPQRKPHVPSLRVYRAHTASVRRRRFADPPTGPARLPWFACSHSSRLTSIQSLAPARIALLAEIHSSATEGSRYSH